jgi:hypothetical protein
MSKVIPIQRFQTHRRNQFDVANLVQVSSTEATRDAIFDIYQRTYRTDPPDTLLRAFADYDELYAGRHPDYHPCDTLYHDLQHSLDVSLALARLLSGYEKQNHWQKLGSENFVLGVIVALFHDVGYLRRKGFDAAINGAFYTYTHVRRGAEFLREYLPLLGLYHLTDSACRLIHYTGYEMKLEEISSVDVREITLGCLIGTADLISQMSDRCYLEKCRDRLYPELVLANYLPETFSNRRYHPDSPEDLLRLTLTFFRRTVLPRLENDLHGGYRFAAAFFGGRNLYMDALHNNLLFLESVIELNDFSRLNRRPPPTPGSEFFPFHLTNSDSSTDMPIKARHSG